jgi:hypothetical protein
MIPQRQINSTTAQQHNSTTTQQHSADTHMEYTRLNPKINIFYG